MYKFLNRDTFTEFVEDTIATEFISLDTETSSLDTLSCKFYLFQVMVNKQVYIFNAEEEGQELFTKIIDFIQSSGKTIIAHNAKFDLKVIYRFSNILLTNVFDTMIVEAVVNNGNRVKWASLAELAEAYALVLLSKEERQEFYAEDFDGVITNEMYTYACQDVMYLETIRNCQMERAEELKLTRVIDLEMKLVPVITSMEITGVLIDEKKWRQLEIIAREESEKCKNTLIDFFIEKVRIGDADSALEVVDTVKIKDINGKKNATGRVSVRKALELITDKDAIIDFFRSNLNVNSGSQLLVLLNRSGIPVKATNEKVLKKYRSKHVAVDMLLTYREWGKKISTYGLTFLESVHPKTGRIHSDFNQMGTQSGRFSSSKPNLQNIPAEKAYRECFIARKGYKIVAIDYSQQEYRLAGDISKDAVIIESYKNKVDIHTATACILYNIKPEEVIKEQRNHAKTMNFAILYGTSDYGLAKTLGVTEHEANAMRMKIISGYPRLFKHKSMVEEFVVNRKYSKTLLGRVRFFKEQDYYFDYEKEMAQIMREGYNHLIQGTAADMTKLAMIYVYNENPYGKGLRMLMPEHDEIVAEVREDILDEGYQFICDMMIKAGAFFMKHIETVVEGTKGDCWTK